MDPLTIALAVVAVSTKCAIAARGAYNLREKYKHLENTLVSIHNKSMVISASLGSIQALISQNSDLINTLAESGLEEPIDRAITGCSVAYHALEEEVALAQAASTTFRGKVGVIWREEDIREIDSQLDGQKIALDCVIQALQLKTQTDMSAQLKRNAETLERVGKEVRAIRRNHPSIRVPQSLFRASLHNDSMRVMSVQTMHLSLDEIQSASQLIPASIRAKLDTDDLTAFARLIDEFEAKLQSERDNAINLHTTLREKFRRQANEHVTEMDEQDQDYKGMLDQEREKHETQINEIHAEYLKQANKEFAGLKEQHEQDINSKAAMYRIEMDKMEGKHMSKLERQERKHRQETEILSGRIRKLLALSEKVQSLQGELMTPASVTLHSDFVTHLEDVRNSRAEASMDQPSPACVTEHGTEYFCDSCNTRYMMGRSYA